MPTSICDVNASPLGVGSDHITILEVVSTLGRLYAFNNIYLKAPM